MKLTAIILLIGYLHTFANGFSQGPVTLNEKGSALTTVFEKVKRQTGMVFWFRSDQLESAKPVTIHVENVSLVEALDKIFEDQPLSYTIKDKRVFVKKRETEKKAKEPFPPIDIKGRVVNERNDPVEGVTILVKGSDKVTVTDINGEFSLPSVEQDAILVFSHVSMETFEIKVSGKSVLAVSLKSKISGLDELQVIAYGTTTKRLNTGSVASVKAIDIQKQPISNPLEAITGRMAGVYIQQTTGVSGGGFNIEIRGQNSLRRNLGVNNGNLPLYIVDGVQISSSSPDQNTGLANQITPLTSPLNLLNPYDIESIEVLKDADLTAIYGSRGANGVVLITTKKGKSGKTKVDFNFYTGAGKVVNKMDLLNTKQYMAMRHEAFNNDGITTPPSWESDMAGDWDTTRETNWQKTFIGGTSHITNANINLSGGNERTQFLFGAGYFRQTTVFPGDFADKKGSLHLNVNHASENKRLKASFKVTYVLDKNNLPSVDPTKTALILPPVAPQLFNPDGTLNWANDTWPNFDHPYAQFLRPYESQTNNLIANSLLSYQILPGLQLKANFSYNSFQMDQVSLYPIKSQNPAWGPTGGATSAFQKYTSWIAEPQLDYQRKISKGILSVLIGSTFQENLSQDRSYNAFGYTSDVLLYNPRAASGTSAGVFTYSKYRYNAIFGRINYNWNERYLINLTGRRDGSSRFGPGKQFANFGAIGLGWIFTSEPSLQKILSFLSFGKLRMSYGTTGNDQIPDYGYLNTYSATANPYNGTGGLLVNGLFNADFAWESTKKAEAGIELGFMNDRIFLGANYYHNRSSNQLLGYPLPTITGQPSLRFYNLPATVQNSGWEFEINSVNIERKNFKWTSSLNLTFPKNKLVAYPDIEKSSYANSYEVGKSIYIQKSYHFLGVDPQTGNYLFEDVDKDNSISNPNDLQAYKSIEREYYGGIANSLRYKNFQLDVFVQFVKQTGYNYRRDFSYPGARENQPTYVLDRWQSQQSNVSIQKYTATYGSDAYFAYSNFSASDGAISDASFIRLKNVFLSYQLPMLWTKRIKAQSARVFVQGQNLATITNYLGLDPETQSFQNVPPLRMLTAGIQFTL